ncbi:MAG: flagellar hook-basal body complex protein, partial [Rhodospirillales bacterium]|nr:flagellar hook-basal body complex protein [Rhodospirillales bacterium]
IAQQRAMSVTATNIANAATAGYRGERMVFGDWLVRQGGATPPGGQALVYTQDRATYRDTAPGPVSQTGNPLDFSLAEGGYFTVLTPRGPRLTRGGHYELSAAGQIVDGQGNALLDTAGKPIQVGIADGTLAVSGDGTITGANGQLGRIGVVRPADEQKLLAEGGLLFNAGATTTTPLAAPRITQGTLEGSNIQPTMELTRMMNDLREFQFVSQFVQGEADRQQGAIDKITQKNG